MSFSLRKFCRVTLISNLLPRQFVAVHVPKNPSNKLIITKEALAVFVLSYSCNVIGQAL